MMEYRRDPVDGTLHVCGSLSARWTLCGKLAQEWDPGDETHNGVGADCPRCRRAAQVRTEASNDVREAAREQAWERRYS